jgi:hypothetical protein
MNDESPNRLRRRKFVKLVAVGGISAVAGPLLAHPLFAQQSAVPSKPATNVLDALKIPRTSMSLPGKFPGKVASAHDEKSIANDAPDPAILDRMISRSLLALTGASSASHAWREFVGPEDIIGLKVNPVAGKLLSTSPALVHVVISQLEAAGIPRKNIVIWDRREFELHDVGFTSTNFPGIRVVGTEQKDNEGSYYDSEGKLYGERMIDKEWYYWADVEEHYDAETLPYMVNEGKHSYFSRICTKDVTKIINIPILKNAGPSVTLCLKNLAFGTISNTGRLHKQLWAETCAEVPSFPPLRDKVVLNIVDGIKGCYNGGPAANPEFVTAFNTILVGTDPVAVDRIGYEIILRKRLELGIQKEESPRGGTFLDLAQKLNLGTADRQKIDLEDVSG